MRTSERTEYRPRPITFCVKCGTAHITRLDAELCCKGKRSNPDHATTLRED